MKINKSKMPKTPKKCAPRLTVARFNKIQKFKRMSGTDQKKYGGLGSPKWGDELHTFLADKRISREDVQRWIDTKTEVTEPLPIIQNSEPKANASPEQQLWSVTGRALRKCRHPEVLQVQRPPSDSSSASTNSQNTGPTIIPPKSRNSKRNRDNQVLSQHANLESENDPKFDDAPNNSTNAEEHSPPVNPSHSQSPFSPASIPEHPDVSLEEIILKDVQMGFGALQSLAKLTKKYEVVQPSFVRLIRQMYRKFEELGKINVVPEMPQEYSLALGVKQELDSGETMWEYVEIDGSLTNSPDGDPSDPIEKFEIENNQVEDYEFEG